MSWLVWMLGGMLAAEFMGAWWHRHVSHLGLLRWIANDGIRARHADHHLSKHSPSTYLGTSFRLSCETSFVPFAALVLASLGFAGWIGLLTTPTIVALLAGMALHGALLKQLHHLAHRDPLTLPEGSIFRSPFFRWFCSYHEVHHYVPMNFGILPLADWLLGTYLDPRELPRLKAQYTRLVTQLGSEELARAILARRLFPGLASGRMSDCTVALSQNSRR